MPLIADHWIAAMFVFLIVMLVVGLATRRLLERRDKAAMEAILAAHDRATPPDPA